MEQVLIAPLQNLFTHSRFLLTLRSQEGKYHGLILFRLSTGVHPCFDGKHKVADDTDEARQNGHSKEESKSAAPLDPRARAAQHQLYVMESTCPHLGAEMSHADIEEYEDTMVAVCPWHRYDFDLKTGKSETGLRTCTYPVEVIDDNGVEKVYMGAPAEGTKWRLVEFRPVSEEFADPPPVKTTENDTNPNTNNIAVSQTEEPVVPLNDPPKTLMEWAVLILNTPNPTLKVERTKHAVHAFRTGKLNSIGHKSSKGPRPPDVPPREELFTRNIVDPLKVKKRRNRAVMLHALANIEQWAWDIMARFGPMHKDLPPAFFSDFAKMALDESKHFSLLVSRLNALGTPYGTFPTHASLWDSARHTSKSFRSRLAIIHLVHEARGLDVSPTTIDKFRRAGDIDSVKVMEIIHADEVTHVTAGHRWFCWACEQNEGGMDPVKAFREEVRTCWRGDIKGPFNVEDREKAGLAPEFYEDLKGEMGFEDESEEPKRPRIPGMTEITQGLAKVEVGYDSKV
ncbi:rieske [Moniliophthora roreri MCA 2997]|uniref:Rieske n=1 Tax=Moniliophthora roreri (strain MCA 2997) TaxID=1381753 RepID=V2WS00_MONRO|nr:rieske [Moniliophthora roreri MCA 2997]